MTRNELVGQVQARLNNLNLGISRGGYFSQKSTSEVVTAVLEELKESIIREGGATVRNFGTFTVNQNDGRTIKGLDGQPTTINPYKTVSFRAASGLKKEVNGQPEAL